MVKFADKDVHTVFFCGVLSRTACLLLELLHMVTPHLPPASLSVVACTLLDVLKGLSETDSPAVLSFLVSALRPLMLQPHLYSPPLNLSSFVSSPLALLASCAMALNNDKLDTLFLLLLREASAHTNGIQPVGETGGNNILKSVGSLSGVASTLLYRSHQSKHLHYSKPLFRGLVRYVPSSKPSLVLSITNEVTEELLLYCLSLPFRKSRLAIAVALLQKDGVDDVSPALFLPVLELLGHCFKTEAENVGLVLAVIRELLSASKRRASRGVCYDEYIRVYHCYQCDYLINN